MFIVLKLISIDTGIDFINDDKYVIQNYPCLIIDKIVEYANNHCKNDKIYEKLEELIMEKLKKIKFFKVINIKNIIFYFNLAKK